MPRKPKRDDAAVKIDRRLYLKAKKVAALRDVPLAEFLSGLIAPALDREYRREMDRLRAEEEKGGKP
jgi:hypothetical protein